MYFALSRTRNRALKDRICRLIVAISASLHAQEPTIQAFMAQRAGLESARSRLQGGCSTSELPLLKRLRGTGVRQLFRLLGALVTPFSYTPALALRPPAPRVPVLDFGTP